MSSFYDTCEIISNNLKKIPPKEADVFRKEMNKLHVLYTDVTATEHPNASTKPNAVSYEEKVKLLAQELENYMMGHGINPY